MEAAGLQLNASASVCNHVFVSNQVWMYATHVIDSNWCNACSYAGPMCCVAAFVTAQTLHTPEPLVLIPICLVMLSNYATAHVVMASLPAVHAYRLSAILAPAKRLTCLELY